jgi:hypothetical protein
VAMKLQKEAALESDLLDMVAYPVRFVRREEIAESDAETFKRHESSQPRKKKKKSQW